MLGSLMDGEMPDRVRVQVSLVGWLLRTGDIVPDIVVPDALVHLKLMMIGLRFLLAFAKPAALLIIALELSTRIATMLIRLQLKNANDLFPIRSLRQAIERDQRIMTLHLI